MYERPEMAETTAARFTRNPPGLRAWMRRAELDHALLGRVEMLATCEPAMIASLVRADPGNYLRLRHDLAGLVERLVAVVDAATEAHDTIEAVFRGEDAAAE